MIDEQGVITSNLSQELTSRINGLDQSTSSAIGSLNNTVGDISMNRLPGLGFAVDSERARAEGVENSLQQQISNLLSNVDRSVLTRWLSSSPTTVKIAAALLQP